MRGTASGQDLPDEVILEVVRQLGPESQQGLYNLSLCSKKLFQMSTPELHRNVHLYSITNIQLLLGMLCRHPDRANGIESLTVYDNYPSPLHLPLPIGPDHIESCRPLLFGERSEEFLEFLGMSDATFIRKLNRRRDRGLWLAFLVLQLPGLREVKFGVNDTVDYLGELFNFAGSRDADLNPFPLLSTIEIENCKRPFVRVMPFFGPQSVRTLRVKDVQFGGMIPRLIYSKVRHLELLRCLPQIEHFLAVLRVCPPLQTLRISRDEWNFDEHNEYKILRTLLDRHGESLESLDFYSWSASAHQQRIDMTKFLKLTKLSIPSAMLLPRCAALLPRSAVHLYLLPLLNVRELTLVLTCESGSRMYIWNALLFLILEKHLTPELTSLCVQWWPSHMDMRVNRENQVAVAVAARERGLTLRLVEGFHGDEREVFIEEGLGVQDEQPANTEREVIILEDSDPEDSDARDCVADGSNTQDSDADDLDMEDSVAEDQQPANTEREVIILDSDTEDEQPVNTSTAGQRVVITLEDSDDEDEQSAN